MFPSPTEVNWVVYRSYGIKYLYPVSRQVSVPYRGEVDDMHKDLDVSIYAKPELFPSPLEVNRLFYQTCSFITI